MTETAKIKKIESALAKLAEHEVCCRLCPRECGVDRSRGEKGFCQSGQRAAVSHALLHYGEEPVLSGCKDFTQVEGEKNQRHSGSGTIFFAGCNLKCSFCQNYQLSWLNQGQTVSDEELALMMIELENRGALNVNLVSPSHLLPPILRALRIAYARGFSLPLVYNANGYEKAEIIMNLDEIIDIYLPDLKYVSPEVSRKFSEAPDYFKHASMAIKEMSLQRPVLVLDKTGVAKQGLIVRHLVLPGQTADSLAVLDWLAAELPAHIGISLMSQFSPCYRAPEEIQRPLRPEEYLSVLTRAQDLQFETIFVQPEAFGAADHLVPDFDLAAPFDWRRKREES